MPAAEIAGLAIGTIALASLFSTCIELFDVVELGKNAVYDYELACTKINLLRERLWAWGRSLNVMEPGKESVALRDQWQTKREIVAASLIGLKRILGDSEVLMQKYNMSMSSITLRKRTVWAIRDRAKFDRLIQDIGFLIEGLEKLTDSESSAARAQNAYEILHRRESIGDWRPTQPEETARVRKPHLIEQGYQGEEHAPREEYQSAAGSFAADQTRTCTSEKENVVSGTQYNSNDSIGIQGLLGRTGDVMCTKGVQVNSQNALGLQGAASAEAIEHLRYCILTRNRHRKTDAD